MVNPEITDDTLHLTVEGADKFFAMRSQLSIPLEHVTGVRMDAEVAQQWWHGFKLLGSNVPGVLTAGTFYRDGQRVFWDIHRPEQAVVISLAHELYNELVIEVQNPVTFVQEVQQAIKTHNK